MIVINKLLILVFLCGAFLAFSSSARAQGKCNEEGSILSVTKTSTKDFETVTFLVNSTIASYKVTTERPPFKDYSGEHVLHIKGRYFKSIRFTGINWTCDIAENFVTPTTNIAGIKNIEQFEGDVDYVIGYRFKPKYVGVSKSRSGKRIKVIMKFKR